MKEKFSISYVILSLLLIAVGVVAAYFFITGLAHGGTFGIVALIFYIPTMIIVVALPLWSGFACLVEQIGILTGKKGHKDE